jgi:hypothetical protein
MNDDCAAVRPGGRAVLPCGRTREEEILPLGGIIGGFPFTPRALLHTLGAESVSWLSMPALTKANHR